MLDLSRTPSSQRLTCIGTMNSSSGWCVSSPKSSGVSDDVSSLVLNGQWLFGLDYEAANWPLDTTVNQTKTRKDSCNVSFLSTALSQCLISRASLFDSGRPLRCVSVVSPLLPASASPAHTIYTHRPGGVCGVRI